MTPAAKLAAGKGAVGYLRVSSREQTDNWSLGRQEDVIRAWSAEHHIPLVDLVTAPDGWESGKDFEDRAGWQAVERHLATGAVGWIVVAAIDRLSRDLQQLAEKVRGWEDQGIAVVAPGMGYGDPVGIGRFMLFIHGLIAEHERHRIIGRVIPGMKARIAAGLPLGRIPLGYRVVAKQHDGPGRPQNCLEPDPATAPIISAIYAEALSHPDIGDRRMAGWAAQRWPDRTWSPGRVTGILTNPVYAGVLEASVGDKAVVRPGNHPAIIDILDFARLQTLRQQRAADLAHGLDAVRASSLLGGIVRCGRCGGAVTWREGPQMPPQPPPFDVTGRYECRGTAGSAGCGTVWNKEIETFVVRALEILLEREAGCIRSIVHDAVERLPGQLDERRKQAESNLAAIDAEVVRITEDLAVGLLTSDAYTTLIKAFDVRRAAAESLLATIDGWTYLARLIMVREGPGAGKLRWVTIQEAIMHLSLPEKRRLLHALSSTITIMPLDRIGHLDGPGEDHDRGIFTGVTVESAITTGPSTMIALGMARLLATEPGYDVARGLEGCGWTKQDSVPETITWSYVSSDPQDGIPTQTLTMSDGDVQRPESLRNPLDANRTL
jgi:DNA invertase Pin-like site-specific DNA recombinase